MDRDQKETDALSPSTTENNSLLRSIEETGGEDKDQMIQATLPVGLHARLQTSQNPVSVGGWAMAVAAGLLLWGLIFYLIG